MGSTAMRHENFRASLKISGVLIRRNPENDPDPEDENNENNVWPSSVTQQ